MDAISAEHHSSANGGLTASTFSHYIGRLLTLPETSGDFAAATAYLPTVEHVVA